MVGRAYIVRPKKLKYTYVYKSHNAFYNFVWRCKMDDYTDIDLMEDVYMEDSSVPQQKPPTEELDINEQQEDSSPKEQSLPQLPVQQNNAALTTAVTPGTLPSASDSFNEAIKTKLQQTALLGEKSVGDVVKDIVDFQNTIDATDRNNAENKSFLKKQKEIKQQELTLRALANKEEEYAKRRQMRTKRAESMYTYFRPILEMDFTYFIPERKRDAAKPVPKYTERAYGIPLMVCMLILFSPLFMLFSIIIAIMLGVNGITEILAKFSKTAQKLVLSLFIIALVIGVVFAILYCVDYFTPVEIFGRL